MTTPSQPQHTGSPTHPRTLCPRSPEAGASDYGNKFGEPLVCGYTRTFGQRLPSGERREWIKPIMFRWVGGEQGVGGRQAGGSSGAWRCNTGGHTLPRAG